MSQLEDQHEIISYLKNHPVVVLGTIDSYSRPHGAAVFVYASSADTMYFVTKSETEKFKNIQHSNHVSVTIADASDNSSLQAMGVAHTVNDPAAIEMVMGHMAQIYGKSADWLPPIAKIRAGAYQVMAIKVQHIRLSQYQGKHAGSQHIFKEITF